ncbi:MAG: 2,3,4,5-tetrahydropyridine-2,6-dicarboxylate N-succinyltransferase [Alphaproteobacteria bacterium]
MNQDITSLIRIIENAWEDAKNINPENASQELKNAISYSLSGLDAGTFRVAEKKEGAWTVNQWLKKAVLINFKLHNMSYFESGLSLNQMQSGWYDKIMPKFLDWESEDFAKCGIRAVPGCFVRHSAYIAPNVVLMPSFVNIGAYVDSGTMVDTWVTIGSCAQVGKNVHLSGGVGIGGVLEPLQANPVIIEDNCFIGARSEIVEGVIVEEGAVISMGVFIGASTKIIDRATGEVFYGKVPAYSVVVPGSLPAAPSEDGIIRPSLYCAVIVKKVDAKTRSKVSVNELLRL